MNQPTQNASFDFCPYPDPPRDSVYSPSESESLSDDRVAESGLAADAPAGTLRVESST